MLFSSIARFEIRYQLKNPVFWVSAAIFFLLGFGMAASANVSIGTPGAVHENSPYAVTIAICLLSIFYLFVITSFVANAVVRDDMTGFGPMIRATPLSRGQFLAGRFSGGLVIAILGYLAVPLGIAIGSAMPWVDPETVGPGGFAAYVWPFIVIALPNLLLSAAFLFMLATLTRSMLASYIGVLVFVMGYLIATSVLAQQPEYQDLLARFEPLGMGAISEATRYWTADEMNSQLLPLSGNVLFNRLFALALAALFLAITWWRFSMTQRAPSKRKLRRLEKRRRKDATAAAAEPAMGGRTVMPADGWPTTAAVFWQRLKLETAQVLKSPGLIVLLLIALIFTSVNLYFAETLYGTPSYPLTADVITSVQSGMGLFTMIVAVFYGGELVWREREVRFNELVDSTPAPAWSIYVPKILAILAVLLLMALAGMATGVMIQLIKGATAINFGAYFISFVIPQSIDLLLIAILAVFVQVLSPNKYVGWGLMLVWFVSRIFLINLGYTNILYLYGSGPGEPLSDMNGSGGFWIGGMWARVYWGCFGILLLVIAHWLWPRGTVVAVKPRVKQAGGRITKPSAAIAAAALAGMVGSGVVIHHNISELNLYRTSDQIEAQTAEYERKYLRYESLPQPVVTDVNFDVAIYPDRRRMDVTGYYLLRNDTDAAIEQVHLRQGDITVNFSELVLEGAALAEHDEKHQYRIYRFASPLEPGESARLDFRSTIWRRGFANGAPATDAVHNGTFVNNFAFAPIVGMDRGGLLSDRTQRRRQGLPDELRMAKLEDESALDENYIHADWVNSRIRVSTSSDQVPLAPGRKVSDEIRGDRRVAVFESPAPILNFFSIQSARYAVAQDRAGDVLLSVYHDPKHDWNVPKMLAAMKRSISYFTENFGPYQFDYARIVEFPGYSSFAQAFAGTMPYSESIGFAADVRDPDTIDYVSYVTAHELAHQYWAHQIVGADMQGGTVLSETLAQYSALMVMKDLYGPDKIRRFLKYELDQYLGNRKAEVVEELPLYRVENQGYIHYRKGSLVMYLLQERLGEEAVNRALARLLDRFRFRGAPYPRSLDLLTELRKEAETPQQQALITDLFERITVYDLKAHEARTVKNADGSWTTTLVVEAAKYYADGTGTEKRTDLSEEIEIGAFAERPGQGAFDRADVLSFERRPVTNGRQTFSISTKRKPAFVGIDPYNFYIDRDSDDNVVSVD